LKDGIFGVCSRNIDLKESEFNKFWMLAMKYNLQEKLESVGGNVAIKGEMVGPGIQANKLKLVDTELFLFDVFNINEGKYVSLDGLKGYAKLFGLKTPPIVFEGFKFNDFDGVDGWVNYATMKSLVNNEVWAEGIVVRPTNYDELNYSFKVINPEFSLKYE
jgi:ATP-dependent RNA circularization protein (DNA/RNA ligase family)